MYENEVPRCMLDFEVKFLVLRLYIICFVILALLFVIWHNVSTINHQVIVPPLKIPINN